MAITARRELRGGRARHAEDEDRGAAAVAGEAEVVGEHGHGVAVVERLEERLDEEHRFHAPEVAVKLQRRDATRYIPTGFPAFGPVLRHQLEERRDLAGRRERAELEEQRQRRRVALEHDAAALHRFGRGRPAGEQRVEDVVGVVMIRSASPRRSRRDVNDVPLGADRERAVRQPQLPGRRAR